MFCNIRKKQYFCTRFGNIEANTAKMCKGIR